jgi:hypothetical protein
LERTFQFESRKSVPIEFDFHWPATKPPEPSFDDGVALGARRWPSRLDCCVAAVVRRRGQRRRYLRRIAQVSAQALAACAGPQPQTRLEQITFVQANGAPDD